LVAAIAGYRPSGQIEVRDIARVRALIDTGDPWSRHQPLHVTASALILEPQSHRVLLRWHTRLGRWLHVGGHGDDGERDPWHVACREAREETGLRDLRALTVALDRRPVQIVIVSVPAHGREPAHEHADLRYALATTRPDETMSETPEAALRWMTIAEADAELGDDGLRHCLRRIGRLLAE
jgi:8-oxo-dGTP pyrophosphatase MutT (NUDIX family)